VGAAHELTNWMVFNGLIDLAEIGHGKYESACPAGRLHKARDIVAYMKAVRVDLIFGIMNFSYIFFISLIFLNPINRLASLVKMI
jgi:hypothetical protein